MKKTKLLLFILVLTIAQFSTHAFATVNEEVDRVTFAGSPFATPYTATTAIPLATTGVIDIAITTSTTEPGGKVIVFDTGAWTSIAIYPTVTCVTITRNIYPTLIKLVGAQNVVIDGSVGGTCSTKSLQISNAYNTSCAISFNIGVSNNIIRNCAIKADGNESGIIFFKSTNDTSTGCDNNTISNNDITCYGASVAALNNRCGISIGGKSATIMADGNKILNNNIYNITPTACGSNSVISIYVGGFTSGTEVTGNSIYETTGLATITPTSAATVYGISMNGFYSTTGNMMTNNFIGGSGPLCASSYTLTTSGTGINTTYYTGIL